jgi:hypothetical protein
MEKMLISLDNKSRSKVELFSWKELLESLTNSDLSAALSCFAEYVTFNMEETNNAFDTDTEEGDEVVNSEKREFISIVAFIFLTILREKTRKPNEGKASLKYNIFFSKCVRNYINIVIALIKQFLKSFLIMYIMY